MPRWITSLLSVVLVALHIGLTVGTSLPPRDDSSTQMQIDVLIGANGASAFQCWLVEPSFTISSQAGTVGAKIQSIGDSTGGTVVFFNEDSNTDAGLHQAPAPQWVLVLKGSGVVTLPTTNATLPLPTGGIIIAQDTADVSTIGHDTKWTAGTVVVQLPFANGVTPGHTVVNNGPCAQDSPNPRHSPGHY